MSIRRVFIAIVGATVLLVGLIMLVTPGPGWLVIFLGLAVLASEFIWAQKIIDWLKAKIPRGKISR